MTTEFAISETPTLSGYATDEQLFATRYKQGGRTVFSVALTPDQIVNLISRPDPDAHNPGNRKIRPAHASGFAKYFQEHEDWVSPGMILRAPNIFTFDSSASIAGAEFGVLSFPKRLQGDLQILDAQHRILGFHIAWNEINNAITAARTQRDRAKRTDGEKSAAYREAIANLKKAEATRDRFTEERVMVEIHVVDEMDHYRQMFFDITDNALGITASQKTRFDTRTSLGRTLPLVLEHPLLVNRVDTDIDRIGRNSPFWLSARHVADILKVLVVGLEGRVSRRRDEEMKGHEKGIAAQAFEFLDALTRAFPALENLQLAQVTPQKLRTLSLLGSPLFVRILAGVWYELVEDHGFTKQMAEEFFAALAPHTLVPIHENSIWWKHAPEDTFDLGASAPNGRRQDIRALTTALVEWAVDKEPFVTAAPEPAPEPEVDPDEGIDFAPGHDTKQLEVELRNEAEDIAKASKARGRAAASKK